MLLRRLHDAGLAQSSYLIGCSATGEALVVDPTRDVEQYLRAAAAEGLNVTHVTETHIHADFVSGSRVLARRAGARLFLSAEGGRDWQYAWASGDGATLIHDGDTILVGNIRVDVWHTPGHTPEHLAFLVTDTAATDRPMGIITGDLLFVSDVGRPDLLERAANVAGTMVDSARTLFGSLKRVRALPDYIQVWPGHGAGSACGKALGAVPQTTIGYEKITNWGLAEQSEQTFVAGVLAGQPEPPRYFAEMKRINRDGPPIGEQAGPLMELDPSVLTTMLAERTEVVDTRPAAAFARGHVPGTINIPFNKSFITWAGWLLPYDRPIAVLAEDQESAERIRRHLALIGLDRLAGWVGRGALERDRRGAPDMRAVRQVSAAEAAAALEKGTATLVDVRGQAEWQAGHIPGVRNIPLGYLTDHLDELPREELLIVHCQSGARSSIGASVLQAHGFMNVANMSGGFQGWRDAGLAVETSATETAPARA